jgi:O-antigen/teichoic acid export membrane protein
VYEQVKSLAFSTIFITISWILYYELNTYAIAALSGVHAVAYYSIGLTCLSFFRSIFGTLFNPFAARFNHLVALNDDEGLKKMYQAIICVMMPAVVFPILSIFFLSKPFVLSWVGDAFAESVISVKLLVLSNILAFISYPSNLLLIARKKIKSLYVLAALQPVIFWGGIALCYGHFGYISFAFFTLLSFLISGVIYTWLSIRYLKLNVIYFTQRFILPVLPSVLLMSILLPIISIYLPHTKSKINLVFTVSVGGLVSLLALIVYFFVSVAFRQQVTNVARRFFPGKQQMPDIHGQ